MTHGSTNGQPTCIDILDDDSLLNIFYHCRPPVPLVEADDDSIDLFGEKWACEYWWYNKLAWVCRRWRRLIFTSPSYLGVSLVCRPGTPVADMLAHSPPFPLIVDHGPWPRRDVAEVEEGTLLALKHRDRVRRIRLHMHDTLSESHRGHRRRISVAGIPVYPASGQDGAGSELKLVTALDASRISSTPSRAFQLYLSDWISIACGACDALTRFC